MYDTCCYTRACIARNVHLADRECSVIEGAAKLTANLPILRSRNGNSTRTWYRKPVPRLRRFVIASLRANFHFHPSYLSMSMAVLSKPVSLRSRPIESAIQNISELKRSFADRPRRCKRRRVTRFLTTVIRLSRLFRRYSPYFTRRILSHRAVPQLSKKLF